MGLFWGQGYRRFLTKSGPAGNVSDTGHHQQNPQRIWANRMFPICDGLILQFRFFLGLAFASRSKRDDAMEKAVGCACILWGRYPVLPDKAAFWGLKRAVAAVGGGRRALRSGQGFALPWQEMGGFSLCEGLICSGVFDTEDACLMWKRRHFEVLGRCGGGGVPPPLPALLRPAICFNLGTAPFRFARGAPAAGGRFYTTAGRARPTHHPKCPSRKEHLHGIYTKI